MGALLEWNVLVIGIGAIAVGTIVAALIAHRRRAAGSAAPGRPTAGLVRLVAALALGYGLAASFVTLIMAGVLLSSATQSAGGSAVQLAVGPSEATRIPADLLPATVGDPLDPAGYFTQIEFSGTGLSVGAELAYFAPRVLIPLLHAIVAFGLAALARRVAEIGGSFAPELPRPSGGVGWSLIVIGSASQLLGSYGASLARFELLGGTPLGTGFFGDGFDITPVAAGIAVLLVGVLVRRGAALQRDTAGLV